MESGDTRSSSTIMLSPPCASMACPSADALAAVRVVSTTKKPSLANFWAMAPPMPQRMPTGSSLSSRVLPCASLVLRPSACHLEVAPMTTATCLRPGPMTLTLLPRLCAYHSQVAGSRAGRKCSHVGEPLCGPESDRLRELDRGAGRRDHPVRLRCRCRQDRAAGPRRPLACLHTDARQDDRLLLAVDVPEQAQPRHRPEACRRPRRAVSA